MYYLWVFLIGGFICMLGQVLIIYTNITSARILVTFVIIGVLAKGAISGVQSKGLLGAFTGGLEATAGGIAAAIFFAFVFSLIFKSKTKS